MSVCVFIDTKWMLMLDVIEECSSHLLSSKKQLFSLGILQSMSEYKASGFEANVEAPLICLAHLLSSSMNYGYLTHQLLIKLCLLKVNVYIIEQQHIMVSPLYTYEKTPARERLVGMVFFQHMVPPTLLDFEGENNM